MTEIAGQYGPCLNLNNHNDPQCLRFTDPRYVPPTSEQIRDALKYGKHWTGAQTAKALGIQSSRTIRKWTGGENEIPYAAWRLLLLMKGIVEEA